MHGDVTLECEWSDRSNWKDSNRRQDLWVGPTSVACRAVRVGLVESSANSFSKDDVPSAAGSSTIGMPLAEKAIKPIDERMAGSSDVSSLCCKNGFRVTLFPPLPEPAIGATRVASGWRKVNIQTSSVKQSPSSGGTSSMDSDRWHRWHRGIASAGGVDDLHVTPIRRGGSCCQQMRPQYNSAALLLPAAVGKQSKFSAAIPPSMHGHP